MRDGNQTEEGEIRLGGRSAGLVLKSSLLQGRGGEGGRRRMKAADVSWLL